MKFSPAQHRQLQSWLFGFGIFLGIVLIIIGILASIKVTPYATYTDRSSGIKIKFPAYWKVIDRPKGGALVVFLTPKESALDAFIENVNISIKDVSASPMTPPELSKEIIKQISGTLSGFMTVLESEPIMVAQRPGYRFVYVGDVSKQNLSAIEAEYGKMDISNPLKYMFVWVQNSNRVYIITYVAPKNNFDKYSKQVNEMVKSFQFISN